MYQLIYSSVASAELDSHGLKEIARRSASRNATLGITGILMMNDRVILQVLEGDEKAVQSLYASIERDTRHTDCEVLLTRHADEREFSVWSMGHCDVDEYDGQRFRLTLSALKARRSTKIKTETAMLIDAFVNNDQKIAS